MRKRGGFSLVELLVCIAIIGILMAMYLPALAKARKQAMGVVVREGIHQETIARMADTVNVANARSSLPTTRDAYRTAFRQQVTMSGEKILATELLCIVPDEAAFRAYWNTVINPAASGALEFDGQGRLVARDEAGNVFHLPGMGDLPHWGRVVPVGWEFLSTVLSETSSGTLGTNVLYSDGHIEYVPYPQGYPACPTVADLSHRFVAGT